MKKKTIKKSVSMLASGLVIALVISIIPGSFLAEASKSVSDLKANTVDLVKVDRNVFNKLKTEKYISLERAEAISLGRVNDKRAKITEVEMKLINDKIYYHVEVITTYKAKVNKEKNKVYEIVINGSTGKIRSVKVSEIDKDKTEEDKKDPLADKDKKYLTKEDAIKIALKQIGTDAKLDDFEFEIDDNIPQFEIEMYDEIVEYEIKMHAVTGEILKYEKEED